MFFNPLLLSTRPADYERRVLSQSILEGGAAAAASSVVESSKALERGTWNLARHTDGGFNGNATLHFDNGLLDLNAHDGDLLSPSTLPIEPEGGAYPGIAPLEAEQDLLGLPGSRTLFSAASRPAADRQRPQNTQDIDPPKIRVIVRKRPLNKKEIARSDPDIVDVFSLTGLTVNETKQKVDLQKYVERHLFEFDDALDEAVSNDEVYCCTVQPLVATLFKARD